MKHLIFILFIGFICFGCSSPEQNAQSAEIKPVDQHEASVEDNWEPDVYKTSELAELMRQMHADHLDLKKRIEAGELSIKKKSNYAFIHKAIPTDLNDDTPLFHTYADAYLIADSMVYTGQSKADYSSKFNAMVNACVACHQNFCMGPINKIELLRIKK